MSKKAFALIYSYILLLTFVMYPIIYTLEVNEHIALVKKHQYKYACVSKHTNTFIINSDFNKDLFFQFINFLKRKPFKTKHINILVLESSGGDTYVYEDILNVLKNQGITYDYICVIACYSSALNISFSAENIYYSDIAKMMFHYSSIYYPNNLHNRDKFKHELMRHALDMTYKFSKKTKLTPMELYTIVSREQDMFISPRRAKKMGFGKVINLPMLKKLLK